MRSELTLLKQRALSSATYNAFERLAKRISRRKDGRPKSIEFAGPAHVPSIRKAADTMMEAHPDLVMHIKAATDDWCAVTIKLKKP